MRRRLTNGTADRPRTHPGVGQHESFHTTHTIHPRLSGFWFSVAYILHRGIAVITSESISVSISIPMGGFGESVSALLDTYTRCLGLLKAFKGHGGSDDTASSAASKENARLRGSIRSDRSQIRKAYSSKLSKGGNRLEKGDGEYRLGCGYLVGSRRLAKSCS